MTDHYVERTYASGEIGFGEKPGVVVVDYQLGFTDPQYPLGGAPLVGRGVQNTQRLLAAARAAGVPVAVRNTAYQSQLDIHNRKLGAVRDTFLHDHPSTRLDPRIHDAAYDLTVCKPAASIFFDTGVASFFTKERVDTVIVTGCVTSGCIRASVIDSFSHRFRTIVAEDCVGDYEEGPHRDNLRDVGRRYADISSADACIEAIEHWRRKNAP